MSGNNNVTVAIPGHDHWGIRWQWSALNTFQLNIVGFLAVLGEGSVLANAQVSALSVLVYLPRLLPAPQALMRPIRPTSLPPTPAKVTGVYSGNLKSIVHHVAHVLLSEEMAPFMVRCVEVTKIIKDDQPPTLFDKIFRGQPSSGGSTLVKAKALGPQTWVTLLGFLLAVALLSASIKLGDGMSMLATIMLAGLSTVLGVSNKWSVHLPTRKKADTDPGDAVIQYPNGSFLVVRCEEDVARELYFAPEEIKYNVESLPIYRMLSLLGTIMLMLGIVFLANAKRQLQFAWAGGFVLINIAHWIVAALPARMHWDLSCYKIQEQSIEEGPAEDFTGALWRAILLTKSVKWAKISAAAPQTDVWDTWLLEAEVAARDRESYNDELKNAKSECIPQDDRNDGSIYKGMVEKPRKDWDARAAWKRLHEAHKSAV